MARRQPARIGKPSSRRGARKRAITKGKAPRSPKTTLTSLQEPSRGTRATGAALQQKKLEFPSEIEQGRLRDILEASYKFLSDFREDALRNALKKKLFSPNQNQVFGAPFLRALIALVKYLVTSSTDFERIRRIQSICDIIALLVQERLGEDQEYGGIRFETIAQIKQAYWSAREECREIKRGALRHASFIVLRMNDVPFAESVFAKLMQEHTGELGYLIQVVDVPWSEVGAALRTNRIDVALYNGSIKQQLDQLKGIEHRFGNKLILPSNPLYQYSKYPVLASTRPRIQEKILVPQNSDFEAVIEEKAGTRMRFSLPDRHTLDRHRDVILCDSADDALAKVVDGMAKYCIVGGLQQDYVRDQFSKKRGRSPAIKLLGYLDRTDDADGYARFWVAADHREEAQNIINAMVAIWNKSVVQEWGRLLNAIDSAKQEELVEFINARTHKVFVKNFTNLAHLINFHDSRLSRIELGIDGTVTGL